MFTCFRIPLALALGICIFLCNLLHALPIPIAPEIYPIAENGLGAFLAKIPPQQHQDYGFASPEDISIARLGSPYLLHTIAPELLNSMQFVDVSELIQPSDLWYFPVLCKDKLVAMLVLEQNADKQFTAVSFGYAPLAKALHSCHANLSTQKREEAVLVVIYQAKEFFLAFPASAPQQIIPLQSGIMEEQDLWQELKRISPAIESALKGGE